MLRGRCCWACLGLLVLSACHTPPPANQGRSGYRMDPTHEAPSELGSKRLTSADLVTATDDMAQDIASRLEITNRSSPPRIVVGTIENRTTLPHQNYQIFLTRLRAQLQASGAREGLTFIRERDYVEQQRRREYGGDEPGPYASPADYVLTCVVYDFPSWGTNYVLLDYQLVQLRPADTGPDVGAGAIVWENKYEVKFQ